MKDRAVVGAVSTALLGAALICSSAPATAWTERIRLDDLGGLLIDKAEVSIADFERYAAATGFVSRAEQEGGGYEYAGGWQRRPGWHWRKPEGTAPASTDLPAVHLTQEEAQRYCAWAGGRLPLATEWRQAAYTELRAAPPSPWQRGRSYTYPTGSNPNGANTSDPDPWPRAAPVRATATGVNGLYGMGANVWEWAADAKGSERPTLGGSWWYPPSQMRAEVDAWKPGDFYAVYIGFRCVYPATAGR
jgi:formylglycine-generating enzyme required for sulfatase activity